LLNFSTSSQVDELVKNLTSVDFKDKLIVILAGYEGDMERMLTTNAGLKSRFAERLNFEDLDAASVADLFRQNLRGQKLELRPASADAALVPLSQRLAESDGFGNGRDVDTWSKFTYQEVRNSARLGCCLGLPIPYYVGGSLYDQRPTICQLQAAKSAEKGQRSGAVTIATVEAALDTLLKSRVLREPNSKPSVVQLAAANAAGQQAAGASASAPQTAKVRASRRYTVLHQSSCRVCLESHPLGDVTGAWELGGAGMPHASGYTDGDRHRDSDAQGDGGGSRGGGLGFRRRAPLQPV
jgi:hypothetical protein